MSHPELIDDLVAANRILTDRGVFDAYGHISARDPVQRDRYWLSRSLPPAQVTADDIIEFDLDSNPTRAGENRLFFERVIHGRFTRRARRDGGVSAIRCLIRFNSDTALRPMAGNAVLGRRAGVRHPHRRHEGDLNVCTVPWVARRRMLGPHWLVLRGHGAVVVGNSAPVRAPRHHRGDKCAPADRGHDARAGAFPDRERDRLCAAREAEGCRPRLAALEAAGDGRIVPDPVLSSRKS